MSKEVKRWDELKALAEGMDGWPNKAAFECDDAWCVGAIDEDENLYPVIEIQTEQYDAFDASEPMAKYYAAANPPAILELLAERDALLAERDELKRDVEILEREVKEYAGFLLLLNAVRYRLRREVGDEAFGAARLQRIFLLGYQNAAQLLQILTEKGDLVPAGQGGHQRKFAALQGEQPCSQR